MYASCKVRNGANMDCEDRRQNYVFPTSSFKSQQTKLTAAIKFQAKKLLKKYTSI